MADEYENVYASLVSFANEYIATVPTVAAKFVDFDEYDEIDTSPEGNCVGIRAWSLALDGTTFEVNTMFTITTQDDPSGFTRRKLVGGLLSLLLPTKQIVYRHATTGLALGFMSVVEGTTVAPTLRTKTRSVQEIAVSLKGDRKLSF